MSGDNSTFHEPISHSISTNCQENKISVSPEIAEGIEKWAHAVRQIIGRNFDETASLWIQEKYKELLARDSQRQQFRPSRSPDDRKAHLMRAAEFIVYRKFEQRMAGIDRTEQKLLAGESLEIKQDERGR